MSWCCPNCGAKNGNCDCTQEQLNNLDMPDKIDLLNENIEKLITKIDELINK